jgi:sigma-B regulation protein RsbU (phosphoserine phosphatase)
MSIEPKPKYGSRDYVELLAAVMDDFARSDDLSASLRAALVRITEAMDAESAALFLLEGEFDDPRARLICQASVGPDPITGLSLPASSGIVGRAVASGMTQLVEDARRDPDFLPPQRFGTDYQVRSLMCAPLAVRGARLGAVEVINRRGGNGLFDGHDLEALEVLAAAAALAISNARLTQSLLEQARLRRELELAATVQRSLLPPEQPADAAIHGLSVPARGVSGDFFDILPLPDGRSAFALADVSGKGMNAALIMVKAATLFRSFGKLIDEPGRLLARIGTELYETMSMGMFVTMVVGVYDPRTREVRFSNAGHEPPLLRDAAGGYTSFPAEDPPLGVIGQLENSCYREIRLTLSDSSLYFFTDGCTEGRLADGSMLGVEGLRCLIDAHAREPAGRRLSRVAEHLQQAGDELYDDLTLLVIEGHEALHVSRPRERRQASGSLMVAQAIGARISQLRIVRRLVEAAARQAGAAPDWSRDFALAVDEACQNIIRHGYGGESDGRIELRLRRRRSALEVELVDFAPPVAEDKCQGRKLEDLRPGGLGVHFMHALTDSVRFLRPPSGAGNRLVLSKKLPDRRKSPTKPEPR